MTQPFSPNAMNEEEVRIRRMLAYKSLIFSILQRSFIFLILIALVVAAIVLSFLHRQGQKNFFRLRGAANLIYNPTKVKNQEQAPLSLTNVYQIISSPIVKKNAGDIAQIPPAKESYLLKGLEVSQERKSGNTLTLTVTWDDAEEHTKLLEAYITAANTEYDQHRKKDLKEQQKVLTQKRQLLENEKTKIDEKIKDMKDKLKEFKVCPLCHKPIEET